MIRNTTKNFSPHIYATQTTSIYVLWLNV